MDTLPSVLHYCSLKRGNAPLNSVKTPKVNCHVVTHNIEQNFTYLSTVVPFTYQCSKWYQLS